MQSSSVCVLCVCGRNVEAGWSATVRSLGKTGNSLGT